MLIHPWLFVSSIIICCFSLSLLLGTVILKHANASKRQMTIRHERRYREGVEVKRMQSY